MGNCIRCEGNGRLWADGKAHYPHHLGPTKACPSCGGTGEDDDANESYEEAAAAYCKVTGHLMPGKDGCPRQPDGELESHVEHDFRIWCAALEYMRTAKHAGLSRLRAALEYEQTRNVMNVKQADEEIARLRAALAEKEQRVKNLEIAIETGCKAMGSLKEALAEKERNLVMLKKENADLLKKIEELMDANVKIEAFVRERFCPSCVPGYKGTSCAVCDVKKLLEGR